MIGLGLWVNLSCSPSELGNDNLEDFESECDPERLWSFRDCSSRFRKREEVLLHARDAWRVCQVEDESMLIGRTQPKESTDE